MVISVSFHFSRSLQSQREARLSAQLQHPNILPVYDYGQHDDLLYLVVQYIESGATLGDNLRGAIEPLRVLRLTAQLLSALGYAHERGVIYHDIKPSNILMAAPDWPMLADFGIAKLMADNQNLTVTELIVGTLFYMAPEQAEGGSIDARSDLYSTGVVLYVLLTGRLPFEADTPMALRLNQLRQREGQPALAVGSVGQTAIVTSGAAGSTPAPETTNGAAEAGPAYMPSASPRHVVPAPAGTAGTTPAGSDPSSKRRTMLWAGGTLAALAVAGAMALGLRPSAPAAGTSDATTAASTVGVVGADSGATAPVAGCKYCYDNVMLYTTEATAPAPPRTGGNGGSLALAGLALAGLAPGLWMRKERL